jgi:glycerol-3-phosphate acyltransferase PlsY
MTWAVWIGAAYLIGSIPFGVILGLARGVDIRTHGSGNIGATNVARVLGRRLGLVCFLLDVAKGAAPVLAAGALTGVLGRPAASGDPAAATLTQQEMWLWLAVASSAVAGHMWPLFLRLRGGKGVATGFGGMVAMWPVLTFPALGAIVIWYAVLRFSRYVSLSSIVAAASLPVCYVLTVVPHDALDRPFSDTLRQVTGAWPPAAVTVGMAVMVVWRHRANIGRIRRGEEPKVGGEARKGALLHRDE